jgi:hypothetical protein
MQKLKRDPYSQKYAGSGLMASTINENFHLLGLLIAAYFLNDLYWRSLSSGFFLIENSTFSPEIA